MKKTRLEISKEVSTETVLDSWINARYQASVMNAKCDELKPMALKEALKIRSKRASNIVAEGIGYKVIIRHVPESDKQFQKRINSHPDIESVNFDIEEEKTKAQKENAEEIESIKNQIDNLRLRIELLSNTDLGRKYQQEKEQIIADNGLGKKESSPQLVLQNV
jgi:hypothetical protein